MEEYKFIFESDVKKYKKKLNFSYIWAKRSDNKPKQLVQAKLNVDKLKSYKYLFDLDMLDMLSNSNKSNKFNNLDFFVSIYPMYKKLSDSIYKLYKIKFRKKISLEKHYMTDGNNFILKKNKHIYKGVKFFTKPNCEPKISVDLPFGYFGDKYIGYYYAKRYNGSLQVYKTMSDVRLFNVTNDQNLLDILGQIEKLMHTNSNKIFFNNITYGEFYKAIKTKYGVGIDKYQQAWNISKYSKFNDIWLYEPEFKYNTYTNFTDKSYTGWYYGAGFIDRVCAHGLMLLLKDKFDGLTGKTGFFSPYTSITSTEIVLWNQNVIKRCPTHKYDSMQFVKNLSFDPTSIKFNDIFSTLNKNLLVLKYYFDNLVNQTDQANYDKIIYDQLQTKLDKINKINKMNKFIKFLSLDMEDLQIINLNITLNKVCDLLYNLVKKLQIDIIFIQISIDKNPILINIIKLIIDSTYQIMYNGQFIIIYDKNLNIKFGNGDNFFQNITINYLNISIVKLTNGKSFYNKTNSLLFPDQIIDIIQYNYDLRKQQLDYVFQTNPMYIIGNFSFSNLDDEYQYMLDNSYKTNLIGPTTIKHNKLFQTDFVFFNAKSDKSNKSNKSDESDESNESNKSRLFYSQIKFPHFIHLPIVGILNANYNGLY